MITVPGLSRADRARAAYGVQFECPPRAVCKLTGRSRSATSAGPRPVRKILIARSWWSGRQAVNTFRRIVMLVAGPRHARRGAAGLDPGPRPPRQPCLGTGGKDWRPRQKAGPFADLPDAHYDSRAGPAVTRS